MDSGLNFLYDLAAALILDSFQQTDLVSSVPTKNIYVSFKMDFIEFVSDWMFKSHRQ